MPGGSAMAAERYACGSEGPKGVKIALPVAGAVDADVDTDAGGAYSGGVRVVTPTTELTSTERDQQAHAGHHSSHHAVARGGNGGKDREDDEDVVAAIGAHRFWLTFNDGALEDRYTHFAYVHSSFYGGKLWHLVAFVIVLLSFFYYHSIRHGFSGKMFVSSYWIAMTITGIATLGMGICCCVESLYQYRETFFLISLFTHWPAFTIAFFYGLGPPFVYSIPILSGCFFFCTFVVQARFSRLIWFLTVSPLLTLLISTLTFPYNFWDVHRVAEIIYWGLLFFPVALVYFFEVNSRRYYVRMESCESRIKDIEAKIEATRNLIARFFPFSPTKDLLAQGATERCHEYINTGMLVTDLAGFTAWTSRTEPVVVIDTLGQMFSAMDELMDAHEVEKISTVGDCLIAATFPRHAVARRQRATNTIIYCVKILPLGGELSLRIGAHFGRLTGGFVGTSPPKFEVFGEDIERTKVLEQDGVPGKVHASRALLRLALGAPIGAQDITAESVAFKAWDQHEGCEKDDPLVPGVVPPPEIVVKGTNNISHGQGRRRRPSSLLPQLAHDRSLCGTGAGVQMAAAVNDGDGRFVDGGEGDDHGEDDDESAAFMAPSALATSSAFSALEVFYISKALVEMGSPGERFVPPSAQELPLATGAPSGGEGGAAPPATASGGVATHSSAVHALATESSLLRSGTTLVVEELSAVPSSSSMSPNIINGRTSRNLLPAPSALFTSSSLSTDPPISARHRSNSLSTSVNNFEHPSPSLSSQGGGPVGAGGSITSANDPLFARTSSVPKGALILRSTSSRRRLSKNREQLTLEGSSAANEMAPITVTTAALLSNHSQSGSIAAAGSSGDRNDSGAQRSPPLAPRQVSSENGGGGGGEDSKDEEVGMFALQRGTTEFLADGSEMASQDGNEYEAIEPERFHQLLLQFDDRILEAKFRLFIRDSGLVERAQWVLWVMQVYLVLGHILLGCFDAMRNRLLLSFNVVVLTVMVFVFRRSMAFTGFTLFVCVSYFSMALAATFQSATCSDDAPFYTGLIIAMYLLMNFLVTQFMLSKRQTMRLVMNLVCCAFGYICNAIRTWGLGDAVLPFDLVWLVGFLGLAFVSFFADFALRSAFVADRHLQKLLRVSKGRHQQATKAAMDVMLPNFVSARILGEEKHGRSHRGDGAGDGSSDPLRSDAQHQHDNGSDGGEEDHNAGDFGADLSGEDSMSLETTSFLGSSSDYGNDVPDISQLSIADKLWEFRGVCVMFVKFEIGGADQLLQSEFINLIHYTFVAIEQILRTHGIHKVKTISTSVMCVSGIRNERDCVLRMVAAAIQLRHEVLERHRGDWSYAVGMDYGPVMGAVLGTENLMFDCFSNSVNLASRMTTTARNHAIQISGAVNERCCTAFETVAREPIHVKGRGMVQPFEVTGAPALEKSTGTAGENSFSPHGGPGRLGGGGGSGGAVSF